VKHSLPRRYAPRKVLYYYSLILFGFQETVVIASEAWQSARESWSELSNSIQLGRVAIPSFVRVCIPL